MIKLSDFHFKLFVFVAFAANLLLRLYKIDLSPLSYDESITAKDTLLNFGHIKHEADWDSNPPFYHYCMWIWAKIFGISEFAMRSFSAVLCSVTMWICSLYIWRNFSKISAFVFILLFSFHPVIFYYSQEARCFMLIFLLASLSLITFKSFLDSPSFFKALLLGLLNFLLIYTHYITFYIPLFQTFIVIFLQRSAFKWFAASALISLGLAVLRFTKGQFQLILGTSPKATSRAWLEKATFNDLIDFMTKMYFHYILFTAIVCFLCYVTFKYKDSYAGNTRMIQYLCLLSMLIPPAHFIIGKFIPLFVDRYILYSVLFTLIFLSIGINFSRAGHVLVVLMVVLGACSLKLTYVKDFDLRSVANYVHTNQKDRAVIIHTSDLNGLFTYYYDRNAYLKLDINGNFDLRNKNIFTARSLEDFKQLPIDYEKDILLFQGYDNETQNKDIYAFFRSKGYYLSNINGFHGLKFILLSK